MLMFSTESRPVVLTIQNSPAPLNVYCSPSSVIICGSPKEPPVNDSKLIEMYDWSFVCVYKRPILGDNPKPHKFACEKHYAFHWKALGFSLFTVLFTAKQCTFHFSLCFSLKSSGLFTESAVLFTFCCAFYWKALHFSLFAVLFSEKHQNNWFNMDLSVWPSLS